MRSLLVILGSLAYVTVLPWASSGSISLLFPAIFVSTLYFVCSLSVTGPALIAGTNLLIGVQIGTYFGPPSSTNILAFTGAVLAMPFAVASKNKL